MSPVGTATARPFCFSATSIEVPVSANERSAAARVGERAIAAGRRRPPLDRDGARHREPAEPGCGRVRRRGAEPGRGRHDHGDRGHREHIAPVVHALCRPAPATGAGLSPRRISAPEQHDVGIGVKGLIERPHGSETRLFSPSCWILGKGGSESAVPLGNDARSIISRYLLEERSDASLTDPLFAVSDPTRQGRLLNQRLTSHRLHPHALRYACVVEPPKRVNNIATVQQHVRHVDVRTTTIHARLLPHDPQDIVKVFDRVHTTRTNDLILRRGGG